MDHVQKRTIVQTLESPFEDLDAVKEHAQALAELVRWDTVGVLFDNPSDEGIPTGIVIICIDEDTVVAAARVCVSAESSAAAVSAYASNGRLSLGCRQGVTFSRDDLTDLDSLSEHWRQAQSNDVTAAEIGNFFQRVSEGVLRRGRSGRVSVATSNRVCMDAHGRCMFEGCGEDLRYDPVTGVRGNFAYEGHIVAASETGPRGILYLSAELADEPDNFLLLCDKHHRLVDSIAKADYPAERLVEMRRRFCDNAEALLDGLKLPRIPAFCVSWPVHRQVISAPSVAQIVQALTPIGVRLDGQLRTLNDNEQVLRDLDPDQVWPFMPDAVKATADGILSQIHNYSYRAALFAMGLMPPLIALGALLGNKNEVTPMLRDRNSGLWYWPSDEPMGAFFSVSGVEDLPGETDDVVLELALTARPNSMIETSERLAWPVVKVLANEPGNGSLAHPDDGYRFRQRIQELLHQLKNDFAVKRVHVLPCVSNAASVFFGQAFDSHHPELQIYDFDRDVMVPRLKIANRANACEIHYLPNDGSA